MDCATWLKCLRVIMVTHTTPSCPPVCDPHRVGLGIYASAMRSSDPCARRRNVAKRRSRALHLMGFRRVPTCCRPTTMMKKVAPLMTSFAGPSASLVLRSRAGQRQFQRSRYIRREIEERRDKALTIQKNRHDMTAALSVSARTRRQFQLARRQGRRSIKKCTFADTIQDAEDQRPGLPPLVRLVLRNLDTHNGTASTRWSTRRSTITTSSRRFTVRHVCYDVVRQPDHR